MTESTQTLYAARAGAQQVLHETLARITADQAVVDRCRAQLRDLEARIVSSFGQETGEQHG